MRRRIRHRGAITLAVAIPAVLLITAAYGLSGGFKSAPQPGGASGQIGPKAPPVRKGLNIGVYEPGVAPPLTSIRKFGTAVGHQPQLLLIYSEWNTAFRTGVAWSAYGEHMTVVDQMEPDRLADVEGTVEAIKSASGSAASVQIGFQRRFDAGFRAARDAARSGSL